MIIGPAQNIDSPMQVYNRALFKNLAAAFCAETYVLRTTIPRGNRSHGSGIKVVDVEAGRPRVDGSPSVCAMLR